MYKKQLTEIRIYVAILSLLAVIAATSCSTQKSGCYATRHMVGFHKPDVMEKAEARLEDALQDYIDYRIEQSKK